MYRQRDTRGIVAFVRGGARKEDGLPGQSPSRIAIGRREASRSASREIGRLIDVSDESELFWVPAER
jgi:hypothetical protein